MRGLPVVYYIILLIVLAASSTAVADPAWAEVSVALQGGTYENVSFSSVWWSYSQEFIGTTAGGGWSEWGWDGWTLGDEDTSAGHSKSYAESLAQTTGFFNLTAYAKATPEENTMSWSGQYASSGWPDWAGQLRSFTVGADGEVVFNFALTSSVDLETAYAGEWAYGDFYVVAELYGENYTDPPIVQTTLLSLSQLVENGADFSSSASSVPLSLSSDAFSAGDFGWLKVYVYADAAACTGVAPVPIPAAVLLGLLGLGTAGLGVRKLS